MVVYPLVLKSFFVNLSERRASLCITRFSEIYELITIKGNNAGKISEPKKLNPSLTPLADSAGKAKRLIMADKIPKMAGICFIKSFENNFFITVNTPYKSMLYRHKNITIEY